MPGALQVLVAINASTLVAILVFGFRIIRFLSRAELQHELMWEDYEFRIKGKERRRNHGSSNPTQ